MASDKGMQSELHYFLNIQEAYAYDFTGETFRVLKEKEIKQFGN